jgi:hypothetical protein
MCMLYLYLDYKRTNWIYGERALEIPVNIIYYWSNSN